MKLNPLAFAAGFGIAGFVAEVLLFAPMGLPMFGTHGYGMMRGTYGAGYGVAFVLGIWAVIVSAIFGAIVATVYNAVLSQARQ